MYIRLRVDGFQANVISDCFSLDSPIRGRMQEPEISLPEGEEDYGYMTMEASPQEVQMLIAEMERGIPYFEDFEEPEMVQASKDVIEMLRTEMELGKPV